MRLVIERGELLRALGHVTSVVERRTTIPILSNVLLKASGQTLELKATDLEREVIEEVRAEVGQAGAVTVPAHMLHDIVRKLPEGSQVDIRRDAEKERLTLAAGQARFALQTLGPEDFPDLNAGDLGHTFEIASGDLKRLIDKTQLCDLHRRDALLPQWHLFPHRRERQEAHAARRRHRRPSPRSGRAAAPGWLWLTCRASSSRARRCTSCIA